MAKPRTLANTVSTGGPLETPDAIPASDIAGLSTVATSGSYDDLSNKPTVIQTANDLSGGVAGSIPYQAGVGDTAMLAPGTAGNVLTSQGAGQPPAWAAPAGGGFSTTVYFTTSGSFTIPSDKTSVRFTVTGGGAGSSLGGGGAGGTAIKTVTSASVGGSVVTVTVGAGGTSGNSGGNSVVSVTIGGTLYTITGIGGTTNNSDGGFGSGATGGDLNITGGDGGRSATGAPSVLGSGGGSFWGGGGRGTYSGPGAGRAYGSGAGGVQSGGGASGGSGVIVIEY